MFSQFSVSYMWFLFNVYLVTAVLSHPKSLQSLNEGNVEGPFTITLNTPSMHDLLYQKHLNREKGQKLATSPFNTLYHTAKTSQPNETNIGVQVQSYADTFIYGTVFWGTPPQKFTVVYETGLVIIGPTFASYLVNSTGCTTAECKKDWPTRFDPAKSLTYHKPPGPERSVDYSRDIFQINGCSLSALSDFFLFKGDHLQKPSKLVTLPYVPVIDGSISLDNRQKVGPQIMDLVMQTKSKIMSFWLAKSRRLDAKKPVEAEMTIDGFDTKHCKGDWQFVNALDFFGWEMTVAKSTFGKSVFKNRITVIAWSTMYITGPYGAFDALNGKTIPFNSNGTSPNTIKCQGGKVRKFLPNLELTIGKKVYKITPQQYIIDVAPEIDMCQLLLHSAPNKYHKTWIFGQLFLSSFCTAYDYTEGKRRIGIATPKN